MLDAVSYLTDRMSIYREVVQAGGEGQTKSPALQFAGVPCRITQTSSRLIASRFGVVAIGSYTIMANLWYLREASQQGEDVIKTVVDIKLKDILRVNGVCYEVLTVNDPINEWVATADERPNLEIEE
jgi:hypothetical protein